MFTQCKCQVRIFPAETPDARHIQPCSGAKSGLCSLKNVPELNCTCRCLCTRVMHKACALSSSDGLPLCSNCLTDHEHGSSHPIPISFASHHVCHYHSACSQKQISSQNTSRRECSTCYSDHNIQQRCNADVSISFLLFSGGV